MLTHVSAVSDQKMLEQPVADRHARHCEPAIGLGENLLATGCCLQQQHICNLAGHGRLLERLAGGLPAADGEESAPAGAAASLLGGLVLPQSQQLLVLQSSQDVARCWTARVLSSIYVLGMWLLQLVSGSSV